MVGDGEGLVPVRTVVALEVRGVVSRAGRVGHVLVGRRRSPRDAEPGGRVLLVVPEADFALDRPRVELVAGALGLGACRFDAGVEIGGTCRVSVALRALRTLEFVGVCLHTFLEHASEDVHAFVLDFGSRGCHHFCAACGGPKQFIIRELIVVL